MLEVAPWRARSGTPPDQPVVGLYPRTTETLWSMSLGRRSVTFALQQYAHVLSQQQVDAVDVDNTSAW